MVIIIFIIGPGEDSRQFDKGKGIAIEDTKCKHQYYFLYYFNCYIQYESIIYSIYIYFEWVEFWDENYGNYYYYMKFMFNCDLLYGFGFFSKNRQILLNV